MVSILTLRPNSKNTREKKEVNTPPTSTLSTSKKPKTTHPYSGGSWNGKMGASLVEITRIGSFRSMWSSNEPSSGTTCAYIFVVPKGKSEEEVGIEVEGSWPWTSGSCSKAVPRVQQPHVGLPAPTYKHWGHFWVPLFVHLRHSSHAVQAVWTAHRKL